MTRLPTAAVLEHIETELQRPMDHEPDRLPAPHYRNYDGYTPTQVIAHGITRLTWRESEQMGEAIKAKLEAHNNNLTAAIVAWAEEWEKFV